MPFTDCSRCACPVRLRNNETNNEKVVLTPMTELNQLFEPFRPLWRPFVATVGLFVFSMICFSSAGDVKLPPAPDDLKAYRVSVDAISHSYREPTNKRRNSGPGAISTATSKEWPGIGFAFSRRFSIESPADVTFYIAENLPELAAARKEPPSYLRSVEVVGIATDAGMILDPADHYQVMLKKKTRMTLFAWLSLTLSVLIGAFIVWRMRVIFRYL